MAFLPCPSCRRHVRDLEEACPFCGHARVAGRVEQPRPQTRLSRGSLFAFSVATFAIGCSSESVTSNPPAPVDSAVADTNVADTGVRPDTAPAIDSGAAKDSAPSDTGTKTDSGNPTDSAATDAIEPDDGGAMPLYGLPPPA
jgi:hypothetical protein